MKLTLRVYKDDAGFYPQGVYKDFFFENLQLFDYENISFVQGVYAGGETVELGEVLDEGDTRGRSLLKIRNTLNDEYVWVEETKERITDLAKEGTQPNINVVNNVTVEAGTLVPTESLPYEGTDGETQTVITGIGESKGLIIQKGPDLLTEYKKGTVFDAGDLPTGKTYKVDKPNNTIYWGEVFGAGERAVILSDNVLTIPAP